MCFCVLSRFSRWISFGRVGFLCEELTFSQENQSAPTPSCAASRLSSSAGSASFRYNWLDQSQVCVCPVARIYPSRLRAPGLTRQGGLGLRGLKAGRIRIDRQGFIHTGSCGGTHRSRDGGAPRGVGGNSRRGFQRRAIFVRGRSSARRRTRQLVALDRAESRGATIASSGSDLCRYGLYRGVQIKRHIERVAVRTCMHVYVAWQHACAAARGTRAMGRDAFTLHACASPSTRALAPHMLRGLRWGAARWSTLQREGEKEIERETATGVAVHD